MIHRIGLMPCDMDGKRWRRSVANRPSPLTYLPLWERALEEEIGIAFTVSGQPREQFRNRLYEAKKMANDPRLDELMTFLPNNDEIWICKKAVEMEE
jgi:hypothetical protein